LATFAGSRRRRRASIIDARIQERFEAALFYAREASPDPGLAFIAEFERMVGLLCRRQKNEGRLTVRNPFHE